MRTFKVTISYEVEIVDDPSEALTMLHLMDAVYKSQVGDESDRTDVQPRMTYHVTETNISFEELEC